MVSKFIVVPALGGFAYIHMDAVRTFSGDVLSVLSAFAIGPLPHEVCERQVDEWVASGYGERGYLA